MKGEKPASSLSDKNTQRKPQSSSKTQASQTETQPQKHSSTHINNGSRYTSVSLKNPQMSSSLQRVEIDPAVARLKQARKEENERRLEMMKAQGKKIPRSMLQAVEKPKAKPTPKTTFSQQTRRQKTDPRNISGNNIETQENSIYRQRGPRSRSTPRFQMNHNNSPSSSASPTGPKLSFEDLIKQAEQIDTSKLLYDPIKKSPDPESKRRLSRKNGLNSNSNEHSEDLNLAKPHHPTLTTPSGPSHLANFNASTRYDSSNRRMMADRARQKNSGPISRDHKFQSVQAHPPQPPKQKEVLVRPAPIAKPSESLLRKLKTKKEIERAGDQRRPHTNNKQPNRPSQFPRKKKDAYGIDADDNDDEDDEDLDDFIEYDDDDDGFIVDDEEDGEDYEQRRRKSIKEKGYDRDEIWSMFTNRPDRKRNYDYYDDDEDDMEATGSEILEEEEMAARQARLDDIREQKLLEQRALEKQRRLKKSRY
ncbi:unnamed protein product [[Candida] boidinii]|uniref:Unnamed protein product n=1 Tax=Candida boidinii TaxID=5477 RepID=A0A9W6W7B6_CANBO|nr:unnamed protein product [[Candida] boidinii]GMG03659.1 unnamed protein product [[Candida] boidinii]